MLVVVASSMSAGVLAERCSEVTTETPCNAATECQWFSQFNMCGDRCWFIPDRANCSSAPGCRWTGGQGDGLGYTCETDCAVKFTGRMSCAMEDACQWDNDRHTCIGTCLGYEDVNGSPSYSQCVGDSACYWNASYPQGSRCQPTCDMWALPEFCMQHPECRWEPASLLCVTVSGPNPLPPPPPPSPPSPAPVSSCRSVRSEGACNGNDRCAWNADLSVCTEHCLFMSSAAACTGNPSCTWMLPGAFAHAGQCHSRCQYGYMTSAACNAAAQCTWNSAAGTCGSNCANLYETNMCEANSDCVWDMGAMVCKTGCRSYVTRALCNSHAGCSFNSAALLCERQA